MPKYATFLPEDNSVPSWLRGRGAGPKIFATEEEIDQLSLSDEDLELMLSDFMRNFGAQQTGARSDLLTGAARSNLSPEALLSAEQGLNYQSNMRYGDFLGDLQQTQAQSRISAGNYLTGIYNQRDLNQQQIDANNSMSWKNLIGSAAGTAGQLIYGKYFGGGGKK